MSVAWERTSRPEDTRDLGAPEDNGVISRNSGSVRTYWPILKFVECLTFSVFLTVRTCERE